MIRARFRLAALLLFAAALGCAQFRGPGELTAPSFSPQGSRIERYNPKGRFNLTWPVATVKVSQPFKPHKRRRPHLGVDLVGNKRDPILAAHEGKVIYAGRAFKGYGKMVLVEFDDEWATLYAHLDRIKVKQGQSVGQGQLIGLMGRTGRATGVHLHFELLHFQRPIDPIPRLEDFSRFVDLN